MMVKNRKHSICSTNIYTKSKASLKYAIKTIMESPLASYVERLILYGSCARNQQTYNSDVDLLLVLSTKIDNKKYHDELIMLKSSVIPCELDLPEVDLTIVIGNAWESNPMLYYQNIRREGIDVWPENY